MLAANIHLSIRQSKRGCQLSPVGLGNVLLELEPLL